MSNSTRYQEIMLVLLLCLVFPTTGTKLQEGDYLESFDDISERLVDSEEQPGRAVVMEQGGDGDEQQITAEETSEQPMDGGQLGGGVLLTGQSEERQIKETFELNDDDLLESNVLVKRQAEPEPVAFYPLNRQYGTKEIKGRAAAGIPHGVKLVPGPNGAAGGSYEFAGNAQSYIQFPNNGKLDTRYSMTMLCWVYPGGKDGPIFNFKASGQSGQWGVHFWVVGNGKSLFARFTKRQYSFTTPLVFRALTPGKWNFVGTSYDSKTGVARLWADGKAVQTRNIGKNLLLATQDDVRMGAKTDNRAYFKGRITQMRVYNVALTQKQIQTIQARKTTDIDECLKRPCQNGATCTNLPGTYRCTCKTGFTGTNCDADIDECSTKNGGCSHVCTNTVGSYVCSCPDTELSLADDKHNCEAKGVIIDCLQNDMLIIVPKTILKGMDRDHIRLLDPTCGATENTTHYSLKTPLTGCGTSRRHTKSAVVYSNSVLEIPVKPTSMISRIRRIEIPFICYYSNRGVATAVGVKPVTRKLIFSTTGKGNFTIALELFHSRSFETVYTQKDFPLSYKLRQHMFLQAMVDTEDNRLSIAAQKCFATPTQNENDVKSYTLIDNGCAADDTVQFLPSPTGYYRFTMEAFTFVDQPFVFIHCHLVICNASDTGSTCAKGCQKKGRVRRQVESDEEVYSLAQGPIMVDLPEESQQQDYSEQLKQPNTTEGTVNIPLVSAMAAMTALCILGVTFMGLRKKFASLWIPSASRRVGEMNTA